LIQASYPKLGFIIALTYLHQVQFRGIPTHKIRDQVEVEGPKTTVKFIFIRVQFNERVIRFIDIFENFSEKLLRVEGSVESRCIGDCCSPQKMLQKPEAAWNALKKKQSHYRLGTEDESLLACRVYIYE
jgi:hypothetical protein